MLVCTFAGHRQVFAADVAQKARDALERLVEIDRELTFYTGGMGEFDSLCAAAVRRLRARHPEARVRLYLVLPYLTAELNRSGAYYEAAFDGMFVPRNCWACTTRAPSCAATAGWSTARRCCSPM